MIEHVGTSSRVEDVGRARPRDVLDRRADIRTPRVKGMRRTEFLGELEALGVDIDGDNGRCANEARRHQGAEADGADTKNGDGCARARGKGIQYCPSAGLKAAAKRAEQIQRRILVHFDSVAL